MFNELPNQLYAANSYLDAFVDGNPDIVPWGTPCVRIEGEAYTEPDGETPKSHCAAMSGDPATNRKQSRRVARNTL